MGSSQSARDGRLDWDMREKGDGYHELLEILSLSFQGKSSTALPIPLLNIITGYITADRDLILHISKHMKICSRFGSFIDDALFKGESNLIISWYSSSLPSKEGNIYKDLSFLYNTVNRIDEWKEWDGLDENGVPRCARYMNGVDTIVPEILLFSPDDQYYLFQGPYGWYCIFGWRGKGRPQGRWGINYHQVEMSISVEKDLRTMLLSHFTEIERLRIGISIDGGDGVSLIKGEKVYSQSEKYYREPPFDFPVQHI